MDTHTTLALAATLNGGTRIRPQRSPRLEDAYFTTAGWDLAIARLLRGLARERVARPVTTAPRRATLA